MKNLECSSRGDKRFSAFYAQITIGKRTQSIERWYQNAKRDKFDNVPGKGRPVSYMINPFSGNKLPAKCLSDFYSSLWVRYFVQNHSLLEYAKTFDTFTDMFRGKCKNCQADVIAECVKDFEGFKSRIKQSDFYQDCLKNKC